MTITAATESLLVLCRGVEENGQARLAQSVERQALNLVVGGSSPPVGDLLFFSFSLYCVVWFVFVLNAL